MLNEPTALDIQVIAAPAAKQVSTEEAIRVQGVGKMYRIYDRPQDRLKQMLWRGRRLFGQEFWALRGINFTINKGESVGIIGRNGSGKSTLLQIIAGTLAPTEGEVRVGGRVAALLELGSGFNPEFTGRENVFLNGAILGIGAEEMAERFTEIAAFADIGAFIEQPVKLYSSGMALRLAFAVQAIVPKDLLIVDEALAVGDEAFQRKCMRTLEQFRENGGTVLLVSHSAQAIVRQCNRCIFLNRGELLFDGPSKLGTDLYQRFMYGTSHQQQQTLAFLREHRSEPADILLELLNQPEDSVITSTTHAIEPTQALLDTSLPQTSELTYGTGQAELTDFVMYDRFDRPVNVLIVGERYTWRYRVHFTTVAWKLNFGMMMRSVDGIAVAGMNTMYENIQIETARAGDTFEVRFDLHLNIVPGTYYMESGVIGDTDTTEGDANFLHRRVDICALRIIAPDSRTIVGVAYLHPQLHVRRVSARSYQE